MITDRADATTLIDPKDLNIGRAILAGATEKAVVAFAILEAEKSRYPSLVLYIDISSCFCFVIGLIPYPGFSVARLTFFPLIDGMHAPLIFRAQTIPGNCREGTAPPLLR